MKLVVHSISYNRREQFSSQFVLLWSLPEILDKNSFVGTVCGRIGFVQFKHPPSSCGSCKRIPTNRGSVTGANIK